MRGLEAGGDCVEFGRSTRRRRRWQDDALLQYAKLAAGVEGKAGRLVEPRGFLRQPDLHLGSLRTDAGGDGIAVLGCGGVFYPLHPRDEEIARAPGRQRVFQYSDIS